MIQAPADPASPIGFLLVRRGLPLAIAVAALLLALQGFWGGGWYLLLAVASLAEVAPTFKQGASYLKARPSIARWDARWAQAFRPIARLLGLEEGWILSFCAWNNRRVRAAFLERKAKRPIVLLPHCIQMAACRCDLRQGLEQCHTCGLCTAGDVLESTLHQKWEIRISSRSHKAYQEALEYQPDLMIAVCCPDRLFKGLTRLPEIPAYAIPLQLPHGMCVDTLFSLPRLRAILEELTEPTGPKIQPLQRKGIA